MTNHKQKKIDLKNIKERKSLCVVVGFKTFTRSIESKLRGVFLKFVLPDLLMRKIGKGRVKKKAKQKDSKACACRTTSTPCKGLRPVDPTRHG